MRDIMWIYVTVILSVLSISEIWSMAPGTNQSMCVNSSCTSHPMIHVFRNSFFNLGAAVNLSCSNKTWNETFYVIWKIQLKFKYCAIGFSNPGDSEDNCTDGKSLQNTSSSQSYLHIPNFSTNDSGVYNCESAYRGGIENYIINVIKTVPPIVSGQIEYRGNKMVAVCKAERGTPAAKISWNPSGNSTSVETESYGLFTVESHLELPEGMDAEELKCHISHPLLKQERVLKIKPKGYFPWLYIPLVAVTIVFLAGILIFAQKKLAMLRRCREPDNSLSKSPPTEDVEEVEPYASYVQRVNSIYNSSVEFCSHKNAPHASHAHT